MCLHLLVEAKGPQLGCSSDATHLLLGGQSLSIVLELIWLYWLVSDSLESSCLCFFSDGTDGMYHYTQIFMWVSEIELRISCLHDKQFTNLVISLTQHHNDCKTQKVTP